MKAEKPNGQTSASNSDSKDLESTARGDSEGDHAGEPPGNVSKTSDLNLCPQSAPIKIQISSEPPKHTDLKEKKRTSLCLGKRKPLEGSERKLLHWIKSHPTKHLVTQPMAKKVEDAEQDTSKPHLKITPLIVRVKSRTQMSQGVGEVKDSIGNKARKLKAYTSFDKKILTKADRLVSYWRDNTRQVPIMFKEVSYGLDLSSSGFETIDLSKRKILVGGEVAFATPTAAGKLSKSARKKRKSSKSRAVRK